MIVPLIYHHFSLKEETKRSSNHPNYNLNLALLNTRTYLENAKVGRKQLSKEIKCHKLKKKKKKMYILHIYIYPNFSFNYYTYV